MMSLLILLCLCFYNNLLHFLSVKRYGDSFFCKHCEKYLHFTCFPGLKILEITVFFVVKEEQAIRTIHSFSITTFYTAFLSFHSRSQIKLLVLSSKTLSLQGFQTFLVKDTQPLPHYFVAQEKCTYPLNSLVP